MPVWYVRACDAEISRVDAVGHKLLSKKVSPGQTVLGSLWGFQTSLGGLKEMRRRAAGAADGRWRSGCSLEVGRGKPARLDSHHPCTDVVAHCRRQVLSTTSSVTASPVSDLHECRRRGAALRAGWTAGPEQDSANSQVAPGRRVPARGALTSAHNAERRELAQDTQNWVSGVRGL